MAADVLAVPLAADVLAVPLPIGAVSVGIPGHTHLLFLCPKPAFKCKE